MSQELLGDEVAEEVFSEILKRQNTVFERRLVEVDNLSRQQLEVLAEKGIGRAVRNIAKSRLRQRN